MGQQLKPKKETKILKSTEEFSSWTILSQDRHNPRPQDLQGGDVGSQDAKDSIQGGDVHLLHIGCIVENLKKGERRN